jgi:serine/threonine-protein kinase HipA
MKPLTTAFVKLWGETVGAVVWLDQQGGAAFEFDKAFFAKGWDVSPIQMSLAKAKNGDSYFFPNLDKWTFQGLPGLVASSLPDAFGNSIIDAWLTRNGRAPQSFNPVERLCYIGSRGMGALEYLPQLSSTEVNNSFPIEDVEELMILAQDALVARSKIDTQITGSEKEKADAMLNILRVGTSAGGAIPKAVVAMNSEGHIISGQTKVPAGYDHWVLKFDGVSEMDPDRFGQSFQQNRVELAYSFMAAAAQINMMECKLLKENSRAHFMTKRFDRVQNKKVHVQSLASIGHFGWNPVGSVGYENVFQVMRELRLPYPEKEQQYRRMVFNVLSRNVDDHVKNISYMMGKDGAWKLSPAYDMMFTYAPDDPLGCRHKMTINGKQDNITSDDLLSIGDNVGVNRSGDIIAEVCEAVSQWPNFASQAGVDKKVSEKISRCHLSEHDLV